MRFIYLLSSLAIANFASASVDLLETQPSIKQNALVEIPKMETTPQNVPYVKLGVAPLFWNVGLGYRCSDYEKGSARDHSLNLYTCNSIGVGALVSYKYTRLKYNTASPTKKYSGLGFELGVIGTNWTSVAVVPIPNIEVIFGKEFDVKSGTKWGQVGINLLPVAAGIAVLADGGAYATFGPLVLGLLSMSAVTVSCAF